MKCSIKTPEFTRIRVYMHATFLILIAWIGFTYWQTTRSVEAGAGVILILVLFACMLLHKFGHALTAKRFGIRAGDITLLSIGGVARPERKPEDVRTARPV